MPIINLVYEAPEQGGWQPGANTIVYYPFTSDLDDYSGNGYDLTAYNGATINSLSGLNCLDLTSSNSYCSTAVATLPQQGQARTNMCWVQWKYIGQYAVWHYGTQNYDQEDCVWRNDNEAVGGNPGGIAWSNYGNSMIAGVRGIPCERMHIAVVVNGSGSAGQQFYINGVPAQGATLTVNTNGATLRVGAVVNGQLPLNGYMRDFIIEDKARTAQEIADYYNNTKNDYEISPSDFQEVEWIGMSGTQFIDTRLLATSSHQVETKIETLSTESEKTIFGSLSYVNTSQSWKYYNLINYLSKFYWGINGGEGNGGSFPSTAGVEYEIVFNNSNGKVVVDGNVIGDCSGASGWSGSTLCINVRGGINERYYGKYKFFYFKVYNKSNSEYVLDLMPCYRKSDGVIGMYDSINNKFYANAGSGTFTKGPDVN